jgi:hypothetical protein
MDRHNLDVIGTLAIDFDDVLIPCLEGFVAYCSKHGLANGSLENLDDIAFTKIFSCDSDKCSELFNKFVDSQEWIDLHNAPPPEICVKTLRAIQDAGYRLVVVSAREHRFRHLTLHYLDTYFAGLFDAVCLCNYYGIVDESNPRLTKFDVCYSLGCFALLDDNPKYIKEVEEKGIKGIPFGKYSWTVRHRELVKTEHIITCWEELTVEFITKVRLESI